MVLYLLLGIGLLLALTIWGVQTVPQGERRVVERLGKFQKVMEPGINFMIPLIERVRDNVSTMDQQIDIPSQSVITQDYAQLKINAIAFIRVTDPQKVVYKTANFKEAVSSLIQTGLRSVVANMDLNQAVSNREEIKNRVSNKLIEDLSGWGISLMTVEIKDVEPDEEIAKAMNERAAAERRKEATITQAKARKKAAIQEAQGELEAARLRADSETVLAEATERILRKLQDAVGDNPFPAEFMLGKQYIETLEKLSASDNAKLVILPPDILKSIQSILSKP
jgi:regulator of protease activity HflC (stomatin/prohibitin superfamily)